MENYKDYEYEVSKINNASINGVNLDYEQAYEVVKDYLKDVIAREFVENINSKSEIVKKDKDYLRRKKHQYRNNIEECVSVKGFTLINMDMEDFIQDMVSEFAGYSILEDAFEDPEVSDIYVLKWDTIFVEKNGVNVKYPRTFKSPAHFKRVLDSFLREAGKEINAGDRKIVDFELYQDRGAATHPSVSPNGYSLTIRKHTEEHITRDQLLEQEVVNQKLIDLIGLLVLGESNIICAGITGSGKTTTIRAILDFYVTKANKRMLVCEDTQELFPKNEHTLEMVSVRSGDPVTAVTLQTLIYTSLRLKPKYIVVGEVRGLEAEAAVEGMETGHSTIFTMHGQHPWNIINRLVTKYITAMPNLGNEVVERIVGSGVDYIFVQDHIPGIGRKVTKLSEVSFDFIENKIKLKTICSFNGATLQWEFKNKLSPDKADKMFRRGVPMQALEPWIEGGKLIYD